MTCCSLIGPALILGQWGSRNNSEFLLAARWACLLLLILHFLGGAGERGTASGLRVAVADILFSLFLRGEPRWEWECTELPGRGALEFFL